MSAPSAYLSIRDARPSDYKAVARLSRRAVGPGDYVLEILKDVIADKGLLLAWDRNQLAGMMHFEKCIDGSGWLSMARTHPDWRRRGIALTLQDHITRYARRKGIKSLKLWVLARNRPSILTCMKAGFRPICEASHVSYASRGKRKLRRIPPLNWMSRSSLRPLLRSPYVAKMNGYFAYKWHFLKATEDLLDILLQKEELYWDGELAFILTKPEISFGRLYSSFTPLIGSLAQSLREVKQVAKSLGPVSLGCYIPYDAHLLSLAQENGFRRDPWAKHCIVFEKKT